MAQPLASMPEHAVLAAKVAALEEPVSATRPDSAEQRQRGNAAPESYSIHGEQAARRRAIGELIFFAGVNDLRRCRQIAQTWNIKVTVKAMAFGH